MNDLYKMLSDIQDNWTSSMTFCKKNPPLKTEPNRPSVNIRNILVNEQKRIVTVVFDDGKELIKCSKDDHFDANIGVALAIAQHLYLSKNQFHKMVEKTAKYVIAKETKGKK